MDQNTEVKSIATYRKSGSEWKKKASKKDPTLGGTRQFTSLTPGSQGQFIRTDMPGRITTLVVQDPITMRQFITTSFTKHTKFPFKLS